MRIHAIFSLSDSLFEGIYITEYVLYCRIDVVNDKKSKASFQFLALYHCLPEQSEKDHQLPCAYLLSGLK
jgi:hypothetical protein